MPAALERCVKHVKASLKKRGKKGNAWAICRSTMGSDAEIEAKGSVTLTPESPSSETDYYSHLR
jgi:hypothetical protein